MASPVYRIVIKDCPSGVSCLQCLPEIDCEDKAEDPPPAIGRGGRFGYSGAVGEKPETAIATTEERVKVTLMAAPLGAEITDIDLARALSAGDRDALRRAWLEHKVLVIRDPDLSEDAQERFCRYLGEIAGLHSGDPVLLLRIGDEPVRAA